jgi:hypothetical protein
MPLEVLNGPTIQQDESLSDAIDCGSADLVRITMPADWTPAVLTFQISSDGNFFNDVFGYDGDEVVINVVPGAAVLVPQGLSRALGFIQFRSGTRDRPVPQEETRVFAVAVMRGGNLETVPLPGARFRQEFQRRRRGNNP